MDDNGGIVRDGDGALPGFKKVINRLLHLNGISTHQATKLRRVSEVDAEKALRAAFTDFTRHEVARLRAQLESSSTLDAKLRARYGARCST
jgi:ribosomal protein S13